MALRKKQKSGPKYGADVVSRDTFVKLEVGDTHNGRRVAEAFLDIDTGDYVVVTIADEGPLG